ncbi:3-oxoacyl-[acyl-carrier-protein] synthase [Fasciolopsis buskii]|uniref:beta-ketoacyl-[acyl-carrier-protein] synthase I n=1 Tax=Fasciolopsis buskii TaxID=27845 RepID=A0A8E0S661_9TREM|nr:3-oxoacyl-[acyl-carrier-protein] synthase [Fasciolopsis buski]
MLRRVAVTGLGICTPIGLTVETFWHNLLNGLSGLTAAPDSFHFLPSKVVGLIKETDMEWKKSETDRYLRENGSGIMNWKDVSRATLWAVMAAKQALIQAGFLPSLKNPIGNRAGTHFGSGMEGILEVMNTASGISRGNFKAIGPHTLTRSLANMPAGVISRLWGLRGPCMAGNTACATGLHSIGDAFRLIQYGEADLVIAGGCEAPVNPWAVAAFSRIRALSTQFNEQPTLASRPFDVRRSGFVISEGAGAMVLQAWPPPDDLAAYCRVGGCSPTPIAEIIGYGRSGMRHVTCDAYNLVSPEPTGDGAYRSMWAAMQDAGLHRIEDVDHINCHATSTTLGDAIELAAIGRLAHKHSSRELSVIKPSIVINSIKGHLGHCLGGAGAIEAVYTALAVSRGHIPGTRNLHERLPSEEICDLLAEQQVVSNGQSYVEALQRCCTLPGHDQPRVTFPRISSGTRNRRVALTNSFGFGGTNASLVLAEWTE